jgi:hypothetical protein
MDINYTQMALMQSATWHLAVSGLFMSNAVLNIVTYDRLQRGSSDVAKSDNTEFIQGPLNMALSAALVLFSLLQNILPLCSGHAVGC